jgi:hypothetical protein
MPGSPAAQHIGIVACSAEGAALCYRTICRDGADLLGPHAHPEVSLHTHALADYVPHLDCGDWPAVARLPPPAERLAINRIIMAELVYGVCTSESAQYFGTVIGGLREAGRAAPCHCAMT